MKSITPEQAQQVTGARRHVTTMMVGEEGSRPPVVTSKTRGEEMLTTQAVGEEGGEVLLTTQMVGEEDGTSTPVIVATPLGSF